ncbi:glycosyltransferase [Acetobacter indonesiensis]|uniref:Glycosyl transferase n=1 Tax=Acetobacter indonesiensis TaxID=104101 RepID=A0A252AXG5_9PROT|nr:glycosyltransferase [Acetobacter indonesiensis]OUI96053.1 glycosyl transferase [Acetobacter indonesiensis]
MPTVLHSIILPEAEIEQCADLYSRGAILQPLEDANGFSVPDGGSVSFDTFYNGFSVEKWQSLGTIENLFLHMQASGQFTLHIMHHWADGAVTCLHSVTVNCVDFESTTIPVAAWSALTEGMLFLRIESREKTAVKTMRLVTETAPVMRPRLGVVITHFNRQDYVVRSIARVRKKLLNDAYYRNVIDFIVVDNSNNLNADELEGASVIPNRNYGGSGGFARGLLYLKDQNSYTHCLFMDDDISCEVESIKRAYAVLSYSTDPKIGLAGVLLDAAKPWHVQEKGAEFSGGVFRPLHQNADARTVQNLLGLEKAAGHPVYGGWWFFAFRLDAVDYYPFPFFVRGDDALFGLINRFSIFTMNGIACFSEHFLSKETALTRYLGFRASLAAYLMEGRGSVVPALKLVGASFLWCAFSYRYESARAVALAVRDVGKGVSFWGRDLAYPPSLQEIERENSHDELPAYFTEHSFSADAAPETGLRKIIRAITLNGHLIPPVMMKKNPLYTSEYARGLLSKVFMTRRVVYRKYETNKVFSRDVNRKTFFTNLFEFGRYGVSFTLRYRTLAKDYQQNGRKLCTEAFWRKVYSSSEDKSC